MQIQTGTRDGNLVLSVRESRLDAHNSGELKDVLLKLLESNVKRLVVDLSAVRFIDSSGLGALLSGYKNANLHRACLVLAGLQPRVRAMFELTRLNRVFESYGNVDEAPVEYGRGLFLIRALMDEVEYRRGKPENVLIMRKRLQ